MNPVSDVCRFYAAGNVKMRLQSKCRSMEIFTEQFSILSHVALLASNTKKKEGETVSGASKVNFLLLWILQSGVKA